MPISTGQFKLEQAADPVCRQLIEELASLGDGARSVRLKKFSLIDGVLFRTTEADDPKEGYDSARIYGKLCAAELGQQGHPQPPLYGVGWAPKLYTDYSYFQGNRHEPLLACDGERH